MKKIISVISVLFLSLILLVGCGKDSDAVKFKKEYESLNGTTNQSGKQVREIIIDKENPMIYKTDSELVKMIENKETFVVYFGFPNCPWCRSVLPTLLDVSKELNLDKIYYVNVLEIRDTLELNDKNELVTKVKGTDAYYKLLGYLDNVLSDYSMTDKNGKNIDTHEKRIYAPNVVGIVNGEAIELTTGISSLQTDGYMDLTEEMINETYNKFKCVIKCVQDSEKSCSIDKAC